MESHYSVYSINDCLRLVRREEAGTMSLFLWCVVVSFAEMFMAIGMIDVASELSAAARESRILKAALAAARRVREELNRR